MKITLDGKALEKLIGGDTEVEIELRNCVVQEFSKKYLKEVVNNYAFKEIQAILLTGVKQEINNTLGAIKAYSVKVELQPKLQEKIEEAVKDEYNRIVFSKMEEMRTSVFNRMEASLTGIEQMIEDKIDKDIQLIVDKKVGDKLNYIIQNVK